jgi:hypothetical protein
VKHCRYRSSFAQSWSRIGASDAMWRIYSPDRYSVRITTTEHILYQQMSESLEKTQFLWDMGDMAYRGTNEAQIMYRR